MPRHAPACLLAATLGLATPALAQSSVAPSRAGVSRGAFAIEALAGTAGSLAGIAIVGLGTDCDADDLGCVINRIGGAGALGAVGATVGVALAARRTGAPRSTAGAAIGAVVGTGVGLGVHYLLNRNSDRNLDRAVVIPIFAVSQGVVAALGSRAMGKR